MTRPKEPTDRKVVCRNKKALHDYAIEERFEAGLVLQGSEVKSLREGRGDLKDAYALIERGEGWLVNFSISPWPGAAHFNHRPERRRKLLLHKRQILRLEVKLLLHGYTLVALSVYFTDRNVAKVELGLGKGKRQYDKRQAIREREEQRAAQRGDNLAR
jgi:SsrA-binding protein